MKRYTAFLALILLLAACTGPATAIPTTFPAATDLPAPTFTAPPTAISPTATAEPTPGFTGTPWSFDRLSLVIPEGLAAGGSGVVAPEAAGDAVAPWDVAPEHLVVTLDGYRPDGTLYPPQIFVYPAQAYAELQTRGTAAQSLDRLRAVLAQPAMIDVNALPNVPFFNVEPALAAQVKVVPFLNGRGVRVLTQYAMGRSIINNFELIYHFEGLTDDGQFYVIAILPLTAPGLPADGVPGSPVPEGGVAVPDFNDMNADWMGYFGDVRQMLQDLEAGAFDPVLDLLDALIGSLAVTPD